MYARLVRFFDSIENPANAAQLIRGVVFIVVLTLVCGLPLVAMLDWRLAHMG
jgi:hypothetical protein